MSKSKQVCTRTSNAAWLNELQWREKNCSQKEKQQQDLLGNECALLWSETNRNSPVPGESSPTSGPWVFVHVWAVGKHVGLPQNLAKVWTLFFYYPSQQHFEEWFPLFQLGNVERAQPSWKWSDITIPFTGHSSWLPWDFTYGCRGGCWVGALTFFCGDEWMFLDFYPPEWCGGSYLPPCTCTAVSAGLVEAGTATCCTEIVACFCYLVVT